MRSAHRTLLRGLMGSLALLLHCQCANLVTAPESARQPWRASGRVLMIGDSLSVGAFGDAMETFLQQKQGSRKVYVYASCGSSVQHWLAGHKAFVTTCGYRETRPGVRILEKHRNGRRPPAKTTPKIEALLQKIRPEVVIVQLGTNHFDDFKQEGSKAMKEQRSFFEGFARALTESPARPQRIIWVAPPDCSKFSSAIERTVESLIRETCRRHRIIVVRSRALTRYHDGAGDGVHYDDASAKQWAADVIKAINPFF